MLHLLITLIMTLGSSTLFAADATSAVVSCECEQSACAACEVEVSTDFYTAKCGPDNLRVKSCKRPRCEPVADQKQCLAALAKPAVQLATAVPKEDSREPASLKNPAILSAGTVSEFQGEVFYTRGQAHAVPVQKGALVYEADSFETKANGRLKITLNDGSETTLGANAQLKIVAAKISNDQKSRKVLMNLLKGRVRNKVTKTFEDESIFEVKTRTAVAGVRGTDFVTSFEQNDKEWVTEVKTLEGKVRLGAVNKDDALDARMVTGGLSAAFVVQAPASEADAEDLSDEIEKGYLSPIIVMKEDDVTAINAEMEFFEPQVRKVQEVERKLASVDDADVCSAPTGKFNQCSYTCEGNPKGAKTCRTDLPEVSCVRRLCRANGVWAESSRLPASQTGSCEAKVRVRSCDSYW